MEGAMLKPCAIVLSTGAALTLLACNQVGNVYSVEGTVTMASSGQPIPEIQVTCTAELWGEPQEISSATDAEGGYSCLISPSGAEPGTELPEKLSVELVFEDLDGDDNGGSFANKTETVEVERNGTETLDVVM